ncbi:hypothetical protein RclHR1_12660003 [Rhizophagus clarus]|nr:hypothetical protein RclHR1_12660003 [Rhizophagus clarus]
MRKFYLNSQFNIKLQELDDNGAILIVDYKMRILPQTSRETKSEFFGKRGWTLHLVLVYQKIKDTQTLNIEAFDHWSDDTKQDAWFTASSLYAVIENLEHKPKWMTIISDNGLHYHNTQLMIILSYWYDWYNIEVRRWIFLEAGKAKTSIDSHHAQISQAIKRYVRVGCNITDGEDIQKAIQNISETRVSQLTPDRKSDKKTKIRTIAGINNWNEWTWPVDGPNAGHILARTLPHINEWTTIIPNIVSSVDLDLVDLTNKENTQHNIIYDIFFVG